MDKSIFVKHINLVSWFLIANRNHCFELWTIFCFQCNRRQKFRFTIGRWHKAYALIKRFSCFSWLQSSKCEMVQILVFRWYQAKKRRTISIVKLAKSPSINGLLAQILYIVSFLEYSVHYLSTKSSIHYPLVWKCLKMTKNIVFSFPCSSLQLKFHLLKAVVLTKSY